MVELKELKAMLATNEKPPAPRSVNIADVNDAIAAEGGKERLTRSGGFLRFIEGDTDWWVETIASRQVVTDLTIEQWLDEWREKRDQ